MTRQAERLMDDLKDVAENAKDLMASTGAELRDKAKIAEKRLKDAVHAAKDTCQSLQAKTMIGARKADRVIRRHPYETAGIVLAIGLMAGWLASRARD